MSKVINLFAGPSAGKTTNAAELFGYMKRKRYSVEYASEYAKELAYNKSRAIEDQLHVFGEQHQRLYRLFKETDYIITDSPLFLSIWYVRDSLKKYREHESINVIQDSFINMVLYTFNLHENVNFFVERGNRQFIQAGRFQNEEESKEIDQKLLQMLNVYKIPYKSVGDTDTIIKHLGV